MIWRREPIRSGSIFVLEAVGGELRLPVVTRALMGGRDPMTDGSRAVVSGNPDSSGVTASGDATASLYTLYQAHGLRLTW